MLRRVLLAAGSAAAALGLVLFGLLGTSLRDRTLPDTGVVAASSEADLTPAMSDVPVVLEADTRVKAVSVRRGDTLVRALAREGVDRGLSTTIAAALAGSGADLRRVQPSHTLEVTWNGDGAPIAVQYVPSPWLGYAVVATDSGWEARRSETEPDVRVETVIGEVRRSLFEAVEASGESTQLAIGLADVFSSDFDFAADTRTGDRFRLLVEKRYAGESFVDYGRILAAQYVSRGQLLTGVGFRSDDGRWRYYDLEGRALRKSFLRSPLEFTRITSGFTYARPHPILGGVRPHLAVDYAAPVGTPIWAVADGHVVAAGWGGGNGLYVSLRHRAGYQTMYLHLSRLGPGIRAGARVRQRQTIGYVGATGLATGPHLCYRVSVNGRFVNPLSERFLPGEPIPARDRERFIARARGMVARLEAETVTDFATPPPPRAGSVSRAAARR